MSQEAARSGVITPQVIADSVPWERLEKCLVVYEDEHGSLCFMASDKAKDGFFMSIAELHVSNAAMLLSLHEEAKNA